MREDMGRGASDLAAAPRNGGEVALGRAAPDFELTDVQGNSVRLSRFFGKRNVVLVLTRGFL